MGILLSSCGSLGKTHMKKPRHETRLDTGMEFSSVGAPGFYAGMFPGLLNSMYMLFSK